MNMDEQEAQRLLHSPVLKYFGIETDEKESSENIEKKAALKKQIEEQTNKLKRLLERRNWLSVSKTEDSL